MPKHLTSKSSFQTERLNIKGISLFDYDSIDLLKLDVLKIMSPKVTKSLPLGWQNIDSTTQAEVWLKEQIEESVFFSIQLRTDSNNIGFLFLYEPSNLSIPIDIRVGYLLSEDYWGNGLASELISGLITWCESLGTINSITGGVEAENKGSIRVLEKNGFSINNKLSEGSLFYVYAFPNKNSNKAN